MTKGKKTTGLERVYNFIVKFITKNCYSPSIMEICEGAGIGVMGRGKPPIGLMKEPAKK